MTQPQIYLYPIEDARPVIERPFAALIDANDGDWSDGPTATRLVNGLIDAGCQYFVCYGSNAETVHDLIDDLALDRDCGRVVTTYHEAESKQEVVDFLKNVASEGMKGAVVLVRDVPGWKSLL